MYTNDFDVENIAIDALTALLDERYFDYTQLNRKLNNIRHFQSINNYEFGGAFKYRNSKKAKQKAGQEALLKEVETYAI